MNRKQFIESHGATCKNWNWSWSFVNHDDRFVIFGIWKDGDAQKLGLILHKDWEISPKGRRNNGYRQAFEHMQLVETHGYQLRTFKMNSARRHPEEGDLSASMISAFTPELNTAKLIALDDGWYVSHSNDEPETVAEVVDAVSDSEFFEGAVSRVIVNAYERNANARRECLNHYGYRCRACQIDFGEKYGALGEGYVHVHHLKPIHLCGGNYKVDPIQDLIPVCANCHAMIHRRSNPLTIDELRKILMEQAALYSSRERSAK